MNADTADKSSCATFTGIGGFLRLTLVVLFASFLIGFAYGVALLGHINAIEVFLNVSFAAKLSILLLIVSAVFWGRFWRQRRSRGIR
jgi:hypothetical protein